MFEQIKEYYENYDEDGRLFRDNAHKVEYLTTIRYFNRLFSPASRILDTCAGTGNYALYLAGQGHIVTACDLVAHNISILKSKPESSALADISVCNVLDLSQFESNSFDAVLCMGALYHVRENKVRQQAITECVRVCKPTGIVVLAYITKIGAILANINADASNIDGLTKVLDDTDETTCFFCAYPGKIEETAKNCGLEKMHNISADGIIYAVDGKLNNASEDDFQKYMEYHYLTCEDESIIGASIHGLWIGRKM
jgi:2-polyprenyl-3-methyl-5-hydroxy-6-metoxy-1,4-benzoquinol methylase